MKKFEVRHPGSRKDSPTGSFARCPKGRPSPLLPQARAQLQLLAAHWPREQPRVRWMGTQPVSSVRERARAWLSPCPALFLVLPMTASLSHTGSSPPTQRSRNHGTARPEEPLETRDSASLAWTLHLLLGNSVRGRDLHKDADHAGCRAWLPAQDLFQRTPAPQHVPCLFSNSNTSYT